MPKNDIFIQAYDLVQSKVGKRDDWSANDVMMFAAVGIKVVDRYPQLTGAEKRDMVVRIAHAMLDDLDISEKKKRNYAAAIDMLLPTAIDQIVFAAQGGLKLAKKHCKCLPSLRK